MSMPSQDAQPVTVRGGVGGIEARYDDMTALARLFGRAATDVADVAFSMHRMLIDPGLIAAAGLDPGGAFEFEAELGIALDAPGGLTWIAGRCAITDLRLRAAAAAYETSDRVLSVVHPLVDGVADLPAAVFAGATTFARTGDFGKAGQRVLTDDPALLDSVVTVGGGVDGPIASVASAAMADGGSEVRRQGPDSAPDVRHPPRSARDLIAGLAFRDEARHGAIDVRILTRPDGTRAAIVDLPGTKSWQVLPNHDVTSTVTDVRAVRGESTAYGRGVLQALEQAGVRPEDDVMLVGHSEGGLVAVTAALSAHDSGRFHVTHVVTAGAPIGALTSRIPSDIQVLAIENKHDVVPHTDGRTNDDRVNVTTVTVDHDVHSVLGNHSPGLGYLAGARDIDASDDPSIRAFLASAQGFFDADRVSTERFVITRSR